MYSKSLLNIQKVGAVAFVLVHIGLDLGKTSAFATSHFSEAGYFMFSNGMFLLLLIIFNLIFHLLHISKTEEKSDPVSISLRISYVVIFSLYLIIGTYLRLNR